MKRKAKIIDGKAFAGKICEDLSEKINVVAKHRGIKPGLAVILVGDDPASHIYVNNKIKKAREIGININDFILPSNTKEKFLIEKIQELNANKNVHGILVQLPLPQFINQHKVINSIDPIKDVDGFTIVNIGLLNSWQDCLEPSTPQGALILIKSALGENLSGKKAVVLGRSLIVGRPMASILVRESCTVTLLHSKSVNIQEECRSADILVSAIGYPHFIKAELVKRGACVIDVGITRVGDKVVGDVDFDEVAEIAGFISPVPGGVGPMTVACMLLNTFKAMVKQLEMEVSVMIN